jgi:hypothetical protein
MYRLTRKRFESICRPLGCLLAVFIAQMTSANLIAQELTPRAYWPAPKGTKAIVLSQQYSEGDVVTDPSLPVVGVESKINYSQVTYQQTLDLFGRTANLQLSLPYTWGTSEGMVNGQFLSQNLAGISDAKARLSINLLGAPTMDRNGFQALRSDPSTIIGVSLLIQAPTGRYQEDKLLNEGSNRWAMKPAVGLIWPLYPTWLFEVELGVWLFGNNDEFLDQTRKQDPIISGEIHLVKRIRPGFWVSLDANYYTGGETRIGENPAETLQRNSRLGMTAVVPLKRKSALRFSFSNGVVTKSGGDYSTYNLTYLHFWH